MKLYRRFRYSGIIRRKIMSVVGQRMTKRKRIIKSRGTRVEGLVKSGANYARSWKPVVSVKGSGAP